MVPTGEAHDVPLDLLIGWGGKYPHPISHLCDGRQTFRFMVLFLGFWSFGSLRNDCVRAHLWLAGGCGLAASQSANNESIDRQYYRYWVFISALPDYLVKIILVSCKNLLLASLTWSMASDRQGVNLVSFMGFGTFLNCAQIVFLTEVTCVWLWVQYRLAQSWGCS